ncbi:unnamed protein product [Peronospora effusa]|uniref:U6 snRNA phosphodiesterase n=1 Tax=Peronospora effusa TaxID=542832 RepID=A0A3M6VGU7_9STRA|nr:hypothetical protein DD238_001763 [Peronospora effusa]CAI5704694.1 unnamed protein product [Peronospora effusa]
MESIVAAYGGSSSELSDAASPASSQSEAECTATDESTGDGGMRSGLKRKRFDEPQRKRAFSHVDGNWPSHVRINIPVDQDLRELAREAIDRTQKVVGKAVALVAFEELGLGKYQATSESLELHLSLSRPFVLNYDQINVFVDSLRVALKWRERFSVTLCRTLVLVNDNKTRSFLALRVVKGGDEFVKVLRCVDVCLARFKQPIYYKDPIPHVSIASSMGEELAQLTSDQCESLPISSPERQHMTTPRSFTTSVAAIHVAIGNKHYDIPLR